MKPMACQGSQGAVTLRGSTLHPATMIVFLLRYCQLALMAEALYARTFTCDSHINRRPWSADDHAGVSLTSASSGSSVAPPARMPFTRRQVPRVQVPSSFTVESP